MSLKLISVRIPESMHTYIKVRAASEGKTFQQLANEIFADHQSRDVQYQQQLNQAVTDSLNMLACISGVSDVS